MYLFLPSRKSEERNMMYAILALCPYVQFVKPFRFVLESQFDIIKFVFLYLDRYLTTRQS